MLHGQTVHMAFEEPSQGGPGISFEADNTWLYWLNMLGELKSKIFIHSFFFYRKVGFAVNSWSVLSGLWNNCNSLLC